MCSYTRCTAIAGIKVVIALCKTLSIQVLILGKKRENFDRDSRKERFCGNLSILNLEIHI